MDVITSRQHPLVKEFRDLARGAGPLMLLDGWHLLNEAAAANVVVEKIAICGPPSAKETSVVDRLRRAGQLVWSGGGGWVYLRGDRQERARFGVLEMV